MRLPTHIVTANSAVRSLPWRATSQSLAVILVFMVSLFLTLRIAGGVAALVAPPRAEDPAVVDALIRDLLAEAELIADAEPVQVASAPAAPNGSHPVLSNLTSTPAAGTSPTATVGATVITPTATASNTPVLPSWDRKDRVNILLIGLDGTASQGRFRRADTLIVASIDPATNSAVLIGIPRDVYVAINSARGVLRNKINTAYVWGELYGGPGNGPTLQMRTVSEFLGIPIHYYVSVYFDGFSKLIDAIGGIDINVPQALRDSYTGWSFNAGIQHMDGKLALRYARSRYSTSDFSRGRRQQLVILAAVDKVATAGMLAKLPAILPAVAQSFRSDMSIPDLLALASLGYRIDRSSIKTAQVDETMVQSGSAGGMYVLFAKTDRVRAMVKAALTPATSAQATPVAAAGAPAATTAASAPASPTAVDSYRSEGAKIELLNGTNTIGLARRTQTYLQGERFTITRVADATGIYNETLLYHDGTKPATRDALMRLLAIKPANVRPLTGGAVNIRIVLGNDLKLP